MSAKFVRNFLSYSAYRQTDGQTKDANKHTDKTAVTFFSGGKDSDACTDGHVPQNPKTTITE